MPNVNHITLAHVGARFGLVCLTFSVHPPRRGSNADFGTHVGSPSFFYINFLVLVMQNAHIGCHAQCEAQHKWVHVLVECMI